MECLDYLRSLLGGRIATIAIYLDAISSSLVLSHSLPWLAEYFHTKNANWIHLHRIEAMLNETS